MCTVIRPYAQRLRMERARLQLSQAAVAIIGKVSKTTQVAYESDTHVPDLEYLNRLGNLGFDTLFITSGISTTAFAMKEFDWDLHREIIEALSEWAADHNVHIPPNKLSDLIHLLYEQFLETRVIEPEVVARALRLVA